MSTATQKTLLPVRRALLSVSDKRGIVEFAKALKRHGVEIISTGGTAKTLRESGVPVTSVSDVTGFPEILNGGLKPGSLASSPKGASSSVWFLVPPPRRKHHIDPID